jgi:peptide/nickel transport system substrate-binding protein
MDQKLSRRNFLRVVAGSTAGAIAAAAAPISLAAPARQMAYQEAPMLADLVAAGSLPPVNERIPSNPRVITPNVEVGQYGGTLRRAFKGISDRWGPSKLNEEMAIEWDAPDPDTINLVANYISEWQQNDDATEFTFTLRDGIKWSDGEAFDTEDVQFWYDVLYVPRLAAEINFYTLTQPDGSRPEMELEVVDNLTWTVRFPSPNPLLPIFIAKSTGGSQAGPTMAAPEHFLRQYHPDLTDNPALIDEALAQYFDDPSARTWQELFNVGGTSGDLQGPIAMWFWGRRPVINAWRAANAPTEDPFIMARNPFYHAVDTEGNQLPYIDQIEHRFFDDSAVFDLWIAQGRIDLHNRHVAASNFTYYKENEEAGNYTVKLWRLASTNALYPNINNPDPVLAELFDTPQFREALSISLNRVEINELAYNGLFEPRQASPVSGSPNYDPEFETRWTEYDPDRANQLLDELGLTAGADGIRVRPDGQPLTFRILHRATTGTPEADEMQLVEDYWKAIGLGVSQEVVERTLYEERMNTGEVDVGVWGADRNSVVMADPGRYLAYTDDGPWAPLYGHWYVNDPGGTQVEPPADHPIRQIWALWEQARSEPDEAQRNALFKQLLDIHKEHPWMIGTVGEAPSVFIVSNNLGNFVEGYISDDTLRDYGLIKPAQFFFRS